MSVLFSCCVHVLVDQDFRVTATHKIKPLRPQRTNPTAGIVQSNLKNNVTPLGNERLSLLPPRGGPRSCQTEQQIHTSPHWILSINGPIFGNPASSLSGVARFVFLHGLVGICFQELPDNSATCRSVQLQVYLEDLSHGAPHWRAGRGRGSEGAVGPAFIRPRRQA